MDLRNDTFAFRAAGGNAAHLSFILVLARGSYFSRNDAESDYFQL
jgi:hypothetical protein